MARRLRRNRAPTSAQRARLADTISRRVCRLLEKRGYLESEGEGSYLPDSARSEDGLDAVRMHAMTYRIATGPPAGRKVTTAQTLQSDCCLALSLRTPGCYIVAINK